MVSRNFRKSFIRNRRVNIQNNNFKIIQPEEIQIDFEHVIGHQECKRELKLLLKFLQNSDEYKKHNIFP